MPFFPSTVPTNIREFDTQSILGGTSRVRVDVNNTLEGYEITQGQIPIDEVEAGSGIPIEVIPPATGDRLYFGLRPVDGMEEMDNEYGFYPSTDIEWFLERADVQVKPEKDDRSEGASSKGGDRGIPSVEKGNWSVLPKSDLLKTAVTNFNAQSLGKPVDTSGGFTGKTSDLPVSTFNPGFDIPSQWRFVSAPRDVSWTRAGDLNTSEAYATNEPFVIYSSTSMRQVTLGDALVEGYTLGKTVDKVLEKLEKMMRIVINPNGFASPYVWRLVAENRDYGFFVIKDLDIKEEMRDRRGRSTRARVSISLVGVPTFQIYNGRDLARKEDLVSVDSNVAALLQPQTPEDGVATGIEGANPGKVGGPVLATQTGSATYYAGSFIGRKTASGEVFTGKDLTAASNSYPFGTIVNVTNLENGKVVQVRINDNGGFQNPSKVGDARIIDLSPAAFKKLAPLSAGKIRTRVDVVKMGTRKNPNVGKDPNKT